MITAPLSLYLSKDTTMPAKMQSLSFDREIGAGPKKPRNRATSVTELMTSMKEATKLISGSSSFGPMRSASSPRVNEACVSTVSNDALRFEVLYLGKLRMSEKKAPDTFIDVALQKFRIHESENKEKDDKDSASVDSRRSSSQESYSDLGGSTDSLSSIQSNRSNHTNGCGTNDSEVQNVDECSRDASSTSLKIALNDESENAKGEGKAHTGNTKGGAELIVKSKISHPLDDISTDAKDIPKKICNGDYYPKKSLSLPVEPLRNRTASVGHAPRNLSLETSKIGSSQYNRTMILIIDHKEVRIVSPNAKALLFQKHVREIFHCAQGVENRDCFGFICSEPNSLPNSCAYIAYIFRCQSNSLAEEIFKVLKQAHAVSQENFKKERRAQSCDHCPMIWYRRLCQEVDGLSSDERIHLVIMKHLNSLNEQNRQNILTKFNGAELRGIMEQNELLMMLLRADCETRQAKHLHDTAENRHEFLNQYFPSGTILMKAKRSITSSFDQFMMRRRGRESFSGPLGSLKDHGDGGLLGDGSLIESDGDGERSGGRRYGYPMGPATAGVSYGMTVSDSPLENALQYQRPRSSTLGAISSDKIRCEIRSRISSNRLRAEESTISPRISESFQRSPYDNRRYESNGTPDAGIGLPRGQYSPCQLESPKTNLSKIGTHGKGGGEGSSKSFWRHAIFRHVASPASLPVDRALPRTPHSNSLSARTLRRKRNKGEIRELWKTAINQQIILIRMEKQNISNRAKQQEAIVKRTKLSYEELGVCDEEADMTWDVIMKKSQEIGGGERCDVQLLTSALLRGIPKHKRGQIWQFFVQQHRIGLCASSCEPEEGSSYEKLRQKLTSHYHGILVDIGRTFPYHVYFNKPLGIGQLALFNVLKVYSLLDTDVGYCQGLCFVAGLILMHLEEEETFEVLKFLMFELGARNYYKPDMEGLQEKMYILTRLIQDTDPEISELLENNDIDASLYAAPWFLTMFASQFPVGFCIRVLDMVLLHGVDVIVKFAAVIVLDWKKELMECVGLERIMDCFKNTVTVVDSDRLDRWLKKVVEADWDQQMANYAREYAAMTQQERSSCSSDANMWERSPDSMKTNQEVQTCSVLSEGADMSSRAMLIQAQLEREQMDEHIQELTDYILKLQDFIKNSKLNIPEELKSPSCIEDYSKKLFNVTTKPSKSTPSKTNNLGLP